MGTGQAPERRSECGSTLVPDLTKRGAKIQILEITGLEELRGSIHLPISLAAIVSRVQASQE